jgi:hypothetical protein
MKINIFFLFVGLFIGFFIIYIIAPSPRVIIKYPTFDDVNRTTFVDDNNQCYRYYAKEVPCEKNKT